MSKVIEIMRTSTEHPGTRQEVTEKLVALGWAVVEETEHEGTILAHDLIPGALRIVSP